MIKVIVLNVRPTYFSISYFIQEYDKMPPIYSSPRSIEASNDSESENRPTLPIDLSDIINNAVAKFKSSTLKNIINEKENLNSHVTFATQIKISLL